MLNKQRQRRDRSGRSTPDQESDEENREPQADEAPSQPQPGLWLYLGVPIMGILLCGSKEPWALGILALLVGVTALFATPKNRLSPWLGVPVVLGLVLCLAAFLPASWFPLPDWRQALQRDFGIAMASTRSPQPGITLESWLAVAVGAVWLVCCAGRGFASSERRVAIRVLAFFCCILACVAMLVRWQGVIVPLWRGPWDMFYFGPFPNRNLFSELLAVGAVLVFAATYDAFRRKQRLWMAMAPAIVPIFAAVLLNTSRAGVMIFFAGIGAWMFTAAFQKRSAHRVAVAAAILLMLTATFLLFGGHITKRFFQREGSIVATLSSESRLQTYADAARVMARAPAFGVGLGNFEPVFAMTRDKGDLYSRALHPENDWLWFGAETGIPCLLLGIVILAVLLRRFGPWRTHDTTGRRDRRLRNAAGIGALLLCVAGMVDPAMHAPGFFTLGCLLAGLALRGPIVAKAATESGTCLLRKSAGVFCVLAGVAWFFIASGTPVIRGNSFYRQLSAEAIALSARGDAAGALEKWNEAATVKPLQWNLYFERARLKLRLGRSSREALEDFARARRLEPHSALLCIAEFEAWLAFDPASGIPALRAALQRDPSRAVEFFEGSVRKVREHPELRPPLFQIAQTDPKLLLAYLPVAGADEFPALLDHLLQSHPELEMFTPQERLRLFQLWHAKGDAADLIQRLQKDAEWRSSGWIVLATHKAKEGDFQGAYEVARIHVPSPREGAARPPASVDALTRAFNLAPTDILAGLDLAEAQRREGKYQAALETLDELAKLPHSPARILYDRALTLAAKGDYSLAWEALRDYDQRLQRDRKDS